MPREQCVLRGGVEGALPSYVLPQLRQYLNFWSFVPVKQVNLLGGGAEGALRTYVLPQQLQLLGRV